MSFTRLGNLYSATEKDLASENAKIDRNIRRVYSPARSASLRGSSREYTRCKISLCALLFSSVRNLCSLRSLQLDSSLTIRCIRFMCKITVSSYLKYPQYNTEVYIPCDRICNDVYLKISIRFIQYKKMQGGDLSRSIEIDVEISHDKSNWKDSISISAYILRFRSARK